MSSSQGEETKIICNHVERARCGDPKAIDSLLKYIWDRLARQVEIQLAKYPQVARWEQTDDVMNEVAMRMTKAISQSEFASSRAFFGWSGMVIGNLLKDLYDKHTGPMGYAANHQTRPPDATASVDLLDGSPHHSEPSPPTLLEWSEFHAKAVQLPPELREPFSLLFYHELPQASAAEILGISERTLRTRYRDAKLELHRSLGN